MTPKSLLDFWMQPEQLHDVRILNLVQQKYFIISLQLDASQGIVRTDADGSDTDGDSAEVAAVSVHVRFCR